MAHPSDCRRSSAARARYIRSGEALNRLDRLVWVDIETTGLDPQYDVILEIAVVVTDGDLNELAAKSWVVSRAGYEERQNARPIIQAMHDANGLWDACESSGVLLDIVEIEATAFIREYSPVPGPICGSSPHFDKSFLDVDMPTVARLFNHRVFDVSTLKQAAAQQGFKYSTTVEVGPQHRALTDIRESIQIARWARDEVP